MSKKELPKSPAAAAYILEEGNILSFRVGRCENLAYRCTIFIKTPSPNACHRGITTAVLLDSST